MHTHTHHILSVSSNVERDGWYLYGQIAGESLLNYCFIWCNPYRPNRWLWGDMLTCWSRNDVHPLAMLSLLYGSSWTLLGSLVGLVASLLTWYINVQRIYENWGEQNPVGEFSKWFRSPGPSAWRPFCFFAAWQKDWKWWQGTGSTSRFLAAIFLCFMLRNHA